MFDLADVNIPKVNKGRLKSHEEAIKESRVPRGALVCTDWNVSFEWKRPHPEC